MHSLAYRMSFLFTFCERDDEQIVELEKVLEQFFFDKQQPDAATSRSLDVTVRFA